MKHFIFILFVFLCVSGNSQTGDIRPFRGGAYESHIKTLDFVVLDINFDRGLLAFKHVYEILGYDNEVTGELMDTAINCNYSGMEEHPSAGIILGVYNLEYQDYQKLFMVYKSVSNESECMPFEHSQANLYEAKAYFLSKNLNIENMPTALPFNTGDSLILEPDSILFKGNSKRVVLENGNSVDYFAKGSLTANDSVIYTVTQEDIPAMASSGEIKFISGFRKNNKIFFLERFHHYSNMAGFPDSEFFHFTKIYDISDFK